MPPAAGLLLALLATAAAFAPKSTSRSSALDHHGPQHHDLLSRMHSARQDCTVVFDAEGSYCLEDSLSRPAAPMTRADALTCLATDECEVPERYASLLEVKQTGAKPSLQVFDSEGSHMR